MNNNKACDKLPEHKNKPPLWEMAKVLWDCTAKPAPVVFRYFSDQ